ncbi:GMC family oxidoreductase N-terminal domain-containing protein [Halorientalis halophila]|uniref:GMC family oxidoreductase N-terminal domain-containing protein n=1 Tax=Halorientalis halophila TaxID=3108499 RepID=UPI00300B1A21
MVLSPDVVVVGAGGDGPALAWRLGSLGHEVLLLEAGPWHGNEQWPDPHEAPGGTRSSDPEDLSGELLDEQLPGLENDANNTATGRLRFGPADRSQGSWGRQSEGELKITQVAGVGGSTLHYYGNHPRATVPSVNDSEHWPIDYGDLVDYYRLIEEKFAFGPGATSTKEAAFYRAAEAAGYELNDQLNVTAEQLPSYRPTPSLIDPPDEKLGGAYDGPFRYPEIEGDTLANDDFQGGYAPRGAPVRERARKSANVSWVPEALDTGNVTIQPNTFVTNVRTSGGEATGVDFRNTWSGETGRVDAEVVVLAAGAIETPRLWLNSGLPEREWLGKGLTHHWFDAVHGVFDPDAIEALAGEDELKPHVGQTWAGRVEAEEGIIGLVGNTPGLHGVLTGSSRAGLAADNDTWGRPWDSVGRLTGSDLKEFMGDYRRTMTLLLSVDDEPRKENGVELDPLMSDANGQQAKVTWEPSLSDRYKRDSLAWTAAELLDEAGADHIHRSDLEPNLIHIHGTMAMGKVVDSGCESRDVDRLFVGDHSVIPNALGGQNPTHTGQALAIRTADRIVDRYLST